jgi:hypothetical protein
LIIVIAVFEETFLDHLEDAMLFRSSGRLGKSMKEGLTVSLPA